jgi:HAD superfamily hydrolase (TIGR01450 family)
MDGTIYKGSTLFKETLPFLALLAELGIGHTFLTNNSSKSTRDYLRHLRKFGIAAKPHEIHTSSQATIDYLRASMPQIRRLFVLGTASLCNEFARAGFQVTSGTAADEPDAVVVGFDTTLTFVRLCHSAYLIARGTPFIATHPDQICPTDQPTVLVDCGSICAALEKATGRAPDAVLGKPNPDMLSGILNRNHLLEQELAVVGDRLYTDMVMAIEAGAFSVLVLTGATTRADLLKSSVQPKMVATDLQQFGAELLKARGIQSTRQFAKIRGRRGR